MQIIEIYRSIQGESSFAGVPCIFVRLAACNLRCSWCDSEYTFTGGRKMPAEEVEQEVRRLAPAGLVEFTGGEPMLQERELVPLMDRLLARGYTLLLETSGERPLEHVPPAVHKIVDVKCPGSGEGGTFRMSNLAALTAADEVKFVLADRVDYEFARDFTRQHGLVDKVGAVLFSPVFLKSPSSDRDTSNCQLDPRLLAEWILADGLNVRLGLQIHKFIWAPATKGV
ncbi:MAG TPA: radical SAM protein [Candidatus Polarisedimenticolia bacterium]|jgi:7-carboxy-7-deazaguanine synthase|nr:radical SAM protein [Candidatus Polarisedimenticolia bacterium]